MRYVAGRRVTENAAGTYFSVGIGCSNGSSSKAAGDRNTGSVALRYVEDVVEPRTMLVTRFSIRSKEPLAPEEKRPWHPRM